MYEIFDQLLKKKGLKVSDVVKGTGISHSTLSDWKSGRYVPKADKLQKIADFLGVSVDYLMTGEMKEENPYYLNDETREIAQFLFEHPEHKILFDASRKLQPEDVYFILQMISKMNNE